MKGLVLVVLLVSCSVVFGKPRPRAKRVVKRQAILGFNLAAFRQDQVNLHNYYRRLHGVAPLILDFVLTKEAQDYAEYLSRNNLYRQCGNTTCNPSGAAESLSKKANATLYWYNEVFDYNFCSTSQGRASRRPGSEGKSIFHFTQVVWASTTKLGIGHANSPDGKETYVVARYFPPGNYYGQFTTNVPRAPYLANIYQDNCNGISGGFSTAWSEPGSCSKPCGKGVRYRTRLCNSPKPSYNGRDCVGENKRLHPQWCNSQACAVDVDERAQQCSALGFAAQSYAFGKNNSCILYCADKAQSLFYLPRANVSDGTLCEEKSGVCFKGVCTILSPEFGSKPLATNPPPATTARRITTQAPTNQPTTSRVTTTLPPSTTAATTTPMPTTTGPPTTPAPTIPFIVINGGYSEWSQPGPCSKSCGGGLSFRTRTCLTPQPGGGCIGPSREVYKVWCNPQPCDPPIMERNWQCSSRGFEAEGHNFGGVDECYLYCRDSQSGYFFYRGEVNSGTPCNKNTGACVDQECVPMMYEPGTVIEGMYTNVPSSSYWKNIIVEIPNGSTNIQITHNNHDAEAVVGYRSNTAYGYDASKVVKGVRVIYHMNSDITIDGPVNPTPGYQIVVYALGDTQADIVFRYTPPTI